jgi:hypothetical protein
MMHIDPRFNFATDSNGRDPDSHSPTLAQYHLALWRKPLPDGTLLDITLREHPKDGFKFECANTGKTLASDGITNSYRPWKRMQPVFEQVPPEAIDSFYACNDTVGGFILFPRHQNSINQLRGTLLSICDRFDLTLECIRLHYLGQDNPLADVLNQNADWFALFRDFRGYVQFFLLYDLVTDDYAAVRFFLPFDGFKESALITSAEEYLAYREASMQFVEYRGQRIAAAVNGPRPYTQQESELIEQYRAQFSEPPWPPFSNYTEDEVVAWARQGLAQGHPIKWEELFAPLPLGTCS